MRCRCQECFPAVRTASAAKRFKRPETALVRAIRGDRYGVAGSGAGGAGSAGDRTAGTAPGAGVALRAGGSAEG